MLNFKTLVKPFFVRFQQDISIIHILSSVVIGKCSFVHLNCCDSLFLDDVILVFQKVYPSPCGEKRVKFLDNRDS